VSFVMQPYNDALRAMRRMCTPLTSPRQVTSFIPLVEGSTHEFLRKVSTSTDGATIKDFLRWYGDCLFSVVADWAPNMNFQG